MVSLRYGGPRPFFVLPAYLVDSQLGLYLFVSGGSAL